ncbi:MAG: response regulator transcription factor [Dehalococcoidia bacterium]|nr:response regulator transcription factor [Dehalococcoidia bacterium]
MNKKILLVDDDPVLLDTLRYRLSREGFEIITAEDGVSGLDLARKERPDLLVLDLMLPELDGFDVCRIFRKESEAPILMLTARESETDKVVGLELGADDYLTKPFSLRELIARIRALLRRSGAGGAKGDSTVLASGGIQVDISRREVLCRGERISLKPKEFELLAFLMANKGQALSRDQVLEKVWGYTYEGEARTIDVHIRWLREKIESDPGHPQLIETVRGFGYRFHDS